MRRAVLIVLPAADHPSHSSLDRLTHEYELKDELEETWAAKPLDLVRGAGGTSLVLKDAGGEPLEQLLGVPLEVGRFLQMSVRIVVALGKVHQCGLVHKDIKPANILVNGATGEVRLTGFGIASRVARERQSPHPPETIAGTLAYMAPEQTGRMNRSIDSRSDLYALGVTFYQMLTGALPFTAADAMEWVHCHLARRPAAPAERVREIPGVISAIVMKLLSKRAEDRYQTAAGLESDLRRCRTKWRAQRRIDDFPLGEHDTPDRLLIPEKLYGRQREIETLLAAFDRVVTGGAPELVLVSGYSGIGKSSVVNELQPVLVPPRGLFASGKFDQYKRDIPYSTLAQAFQNLIRPLLGKSEADLAPWRDALSQMLGPNAKLIADLVPDVKLIIGEPPAVPEVAPQDAQRRFQLVFRQFFGVFARPEHPLVLFLDDLQWLDAATLDLLEDLLTHPDVRQVLLIGAYRDNEVTAGHPLMRKLEAIRTRGRVQDIKLDPLAAEDLGRLVADSLRIDAEQAAPLASLVHAKTGGNPFFVIQFLHVLADEGLLAFDHKQARWSWDVNGIQDKHYTDNVVELLTGKLTRLPLDTQNALRQLACLGSGADVAMLSIALGISEQRAHAVLWEAVRQRLIDRLERSYKFVHDRVQEAAYALIPETSRAEAHLTIGRLLAAHTPTERRDEAIFKIVNQLNRGAPLMTSQDEREQLAELNLAAGKRAKASAAYASALNYLIAGVVLVPKDGWERRHDLIFELELHRAECEFLTGEIGSAEEHLRMLSSRAADVVQRAAVACLVADVSWALQRPDGGLADCLECLRDAGLDIPIHPTEEQAQTAYGKIFSKLDGVGIDEFVERPLMTDPASRAILNVLAKVLPSALITDKNLTSLLVCAAVDISLERGHCDSSCLAYEYLGFIAGWIFGDFEAGFRFGQLGHELVGRKGLRKFEGFVGLILSSCVMPWARHIATCRELVRTTFDVANKTGDRPSAVASRGEIVSNLLLAGEPLVEAEKEAEVGLEFCRRAAFRDYIDRVNIQAAFIRNLRGLTRAFGSLDDERFDERRMRDHFATQPHLLACEYWYWVRRLQARFFAGDYTAALDASSRARGLRSESPGALELVEYELYSALTHAAVCDSASPGERGRHLDAVAAHRRQLEVWARHCPENFENRATLVAAEIARIEGRDPDAMRLYELAIQSARANGFVHNEALAYELAARFYAAHGVEEVAHLYLGNARRGYLGWGADGKVRQLDQLHPRLRPDERAPAPTGTIEVPVERLDIATVIQISQALSGEVVLEKLIDRLMRVAIEHAGADRGLLICPRSDKLLIYAEATANGEDVTIDVRERDVSGAGTLPESLVRYILRTGETVVLDDASSQNLFSADPYIVQRRARSILCLPMINQGRFVGTLYFENNLAPQVFTPDRLTVLKVLATQGAISLENIGLYRALADREAKIRRLVDANILGICIWNLEGAIVGANEAFLHMLQYGHEDVVSGRLRWTDLTPTEQRERDERAVVELRSTGTFQPFEKEFFRKDGSRVPVLIGGALFEENSNEGVAFVLDLTERKQAEADARESSRRYREIQLELAHANRVATMGQLTASIAHEVNQPITATIGNAEATLRWLARRPPDLDESRQLLARIIKDGHRASNVVGRIRDLIKKAPPRMERMEINLAIGEVIELTRGEAMKNSISVQTHFAEGLPLVEADRTQLQQVILNLTMNAVQALSQGDQHPRELSIGTSMDESYDVLVSVRDSGPGISQDNLGRLFDAFYTTKPGGMGMGLSICRSIVEGHGGRIWATENVPRGAAFHFTIPAARQ